MEMKRTFDFLIIEIDIARGKKNNHWARGYLNKHHTNKKAKSTTRKNNIIFDSLGQHKICNIFIMAISGREGRDKKLKKYLNN